MATVVYEPGFSGPATINHGDSVTITGTGFGTKPSGPPLLWDDCSGPDDPLDLWDQKVPRGLVNDDLNMKRRAAGFRGVAAPHPRVGRYLAGAHAENNALEGFNVSVGKHIPGVTPQTTPLNFYVSFYMRADPAWVFSGGANDDNFKHARWSQIVNEQYQGSGFSYIYPGGWPPESLSDTSIRWNIAATIWGIGSIYGFATDTKNPMLGWMKVEIENRFTSGSDGIIKIFEDGRQVLGTGLTVTDDETFTGRAFWLGGFARQYNQPGNFRYYTDIYLDTSYARVMLLGAGTFSGAEHATIREMQIPSAWADTSITFIANQGAHSTLDGTQLYVVDPNNTPVLVATLGSGGGPTPQVPTITSATTVTANVGEPFQYQIAATDDPTSFDAHGLLE